jgi:hypothetical protein
MRLYDFSQTPQTSHEFITKNPAGLAGARSPVAVAREQINDPLPRPQPGADHGAASPWLCLEFPPVNAGEKLHRRAGVKMHHG